MKESRRDFILNALKAGGAAAVAGCATSGLPPQTANMQGFAVPPLKRIRLGLVGLGMRGGQAIARLPHVPGLEVVALCDVFPERVAQAQAVLKRLGRPPAREYVGAEAYRRLCESDLDVVYNCTPWTMHAPIGLYAMEHGKHAFIEVPSALTLEECWALVETAERTRRHCMQLENACYAEERLLTLNLVRKGILGDLVHCEGAYIHDLRSLCYEKWAPKRDGEAKTGGYADYWRLRYNAAHKGNQYETHGFGPLCVDLGIARGDRLERLVSLESDQRNHELYARSNFGDDPWKRSLKVAMGDMNSTLIRTAKGRSILVQHDVSSPRPYRNINLVTGTRGVVSGCFFYKTAEEAFASGDPIRYGWEERNGDGVHTFFDFAKTQEMRRKHMHPLWKTAGEIAKKVGGHGGCDYVMDLRWAYCLQNGLPLDTSVYELASWCSLGELTERSVRGGSVPVDVPDFTRGGWRTAKPLGIVDVDLSKMGV